ncbi:MAG: DEAD/DEAH box helicase [Microbacteriaceae bacterium]
MPTQKKPATSRTTAPHGQKVAGKSRPATTGSRSPGHRGYRPEAEGAAPKKQRWNADERAARAADATRNDRGDRNNRPANSEHKVARDGYQPRGERRGGGDRDRNESGRPNWEPRQGGGSYRGDRNDRPVRSTADRADRPARSYDDRPRRDYGDQGSRPAREGYQRPERTERPAYGDRPAFGDRPNRTGGERSDRTDRPVRGNADRPRRSFDDRAERAPRRDSGSDFYPKREERSYTPQDDVVLERLEAQTTVASDVVDVSFADLGLGGNIVRELGLLGAASPFPIQAATIPDVLAGKDVLGRGRTGSGKTIAFGAPLVERLMENNGGKNRKMGRKPRALILAPTRELALQIDRTVQPIARSVGLFTTQIYGGVPQHRQVSALQRGVDIIVGTPGRIEDLVEQGRLDLSEVIVTVLDEADHMCDLGFLEPVQRILRLTAEDGQKLLFSATLDRGVASLVDEFLTDPAVHEVAGEDQASSTIDHQVLLIEQRDKFAVIEDLVASGGKTLIFARTRAFAEQLADQLEDSGIPATSLHGDLNQSRRTRNLGLLTSGRVNVLVATDVAARGIHVDDISLVIQADPPDEYKTYLHRSGRTGRAGKKGTVVTLITKPRRRRMEELLDRAEIEADFVSARPGDEHLALLGQA